eukprot:3086019-Amphidinium_carterae.1
MDSKLEDYSHYSCTACLTTNMDDCSYELRLLVEPSASTNQNNICYSVDNLAKLTASSFTKSTRIPETPNNTVQLRFHSFQEFSCARCLQAIC